MKNFRITLLLLGIVGGCSWSPETTDTSGSHPSFGKTAPMTQEAKDAEVDTGRLLVLSPRMLEENSVDLDASPITQYTGYTVYTEDGHKVAHEDNHGDRMLGPVERKLAPGRYFVRLDEKVPAREFWVTIERGRVTRVENPLWRDTTPTAK
jgi:hypothetical protein